MYYHSLSVETMFGFVRGVFFLLFNQWCEKFARWPVYMVCLSLCLSLLGSPVIDSFHFFSLLLLRVIRQSTAARVRIATAR